MTLVKICGITNLEDARLAIELGADMIGLNFYSGSKRYVPFEEAVEWIGKVKAPHTKVGVFVNSLICDMLLPLSELKLDAVQLHGDEAPDFISDLRIQTAAPIIKAIRVRSNGDVIDVYNGVADALLLDTFSATEHGGTGKTFDWEIAARIAETGRSVYLAGGLTPENVAEAVRAVRPYAVDVASGVEASPGKKDPKKLEAFIRNAKNA